MFIIGNSHNPRENLTPFPVIPHQNIKNKGPGGGHGGLGGPGGGLLTAALPAAVAGFLALSVSAIFADMVAINSTSNATLPILWQLPIDFTGEGKRRRKRSDVYDYDEDGDDFMVNEVDPVLPVSLLDGISSAFHLGKVATRFRNGMILYALMDSDRGCR